MKKCLSVLSIGVLLSVGAISFELYAGEPEALPGFPESVLVNDPSLFAEPKRVYFGKYPNGNVGLFYKDVVMGGEKRLSWAPGDEIIEKFLESEFGASAREFILKHDIELDYTLDEWKKKQPIESYDGSWLTSKQQGGVALLAAATLLATAYYYRKAIKERIDRWRGKKEEEARQISPK